jgi:SAM-dependent methyltransferase
MSQTADRSECVEEMREFLRYMVLSILDECPCSASRVAETIVEKSRDNEKYREGGSLKISVADLKPTIDGLREEGMVSDSHNGDLALTDPGKELLDHYQRLKEEGGKQKEEAISKLVSILLSDARGRTGPARVLDVGTGEGYLALKLADEGFDVLGIDTAEFEYSRNSIARAREKSEGMANAEFRVADVNDLTFHDRYDYVVSSQAMHCMNDQRRSVCSMCRLLKPGGLLVACDFDVGLRGYFAHGFHCFLALTRQKWETFLSSCGCGETEIHDVGDYCVVRSRKASVQ